MFAAGASAVETDKGADMYFMNGIWVDFLGAGLVYSVQGGQP